MDESLAQEVLLDHFKAPRRRGKIEGAPLSREAINPACGDRVFLSGRLESGRWDLKVEGSGCVISQASASMMAQALQDRPAEEAGALAAAVSRWVSGRGEKPALTEEALEDLESLAGVRRHPGRVKCACLAWNLFLEAQADVSHGG